MEDANVLFVGGAGLPFGVEPLLYVYDVETGDELAACSPQGDASFVSDVVIIGNYAYATDAQINSIMVVDVEAAIKGECVVTSIEMPADLFKATVDGEFLASGTCDHAKQTTRYLVQRLTPLCSVAGIVEYGAGVIISRTSRGGLYYLNLEDESVTEVASPEAARDNDGLTIAGDYLYVAENAKNRLSVWRLGDDSLAVSLDFVGYISSDDYDFPTAAVIYNDFIYVVNFRKETVPFPAGDEATSDFEALFYMTGVDRFDFY